MSKKKKNLGTQLSAPIHYETIPIRNLNKCEKIQPMIKARAVLATQSANDYPKISNKVQNNET